MVNRRQQAHRAYAGDSLLSLKPDSRFQNLLIASIAMGVMIVPTVASMSEDATSAFPHADRERQPAT